MSFFRPFRLRPRLTVENGEAPLADEHYAGEFGAERRIMVERHLWRRGVRDRDVLAAMARVPRQRFVSARQHAHAYDDNPLEIGHGQTVSQPYVVARTVELAEVGAGSRVLEIGVGCGYETAVLLELGAEVWGVEIVEPLANAAAERLRALGYRPFEIRCADGYDGWPEAAPFDAIVLAAAPLEFPPPLLAQLVDGGRLVGPVGPRDAQMLVRVIRRGTDYSRENIFPVRFVPMTGKAENNP
jgi:protein-L-isoaspartate(D-aspartate) O-methyltransferase